MPIRNRIAQMSDEITAWRRDIHAHPELLYETDRTSKLVADKLYEFGCDEIVTGIGRTGVVGLIHGRTKGSGRTIGLRADMDALPIMEATGAPHASTIPGRMHACGHDGHTAMLLGAAKYLAETRNFDGTVAVVFQPAEEGGAGAEAMVQDGLIERFGIDEIYGMHNAPGLPEGTFHIRPGPFYAAVDSFSIHVRGKGGHAARPHETIDTTLVASAIVMAANTVISRNVDPQHPAVVSITSFRTESEAFNVIPENVTLRGTVRSFSEDDRARILDRLTALVAQTAASYGAEARIEMEEEPYPVTDNHPRETEFMALAAEAVTGDCDRDCPRTTGGEDFAYMLRACPGAYIRLGAGDVPRLHHPQFDFNDALIPIGVSFWAELAEQRLRAG